MPKEGHPAAQSLRPDFVRGAKNLTETPDSLVSARDAAVGRYLANLTALYRRDVSLAAQIDALPFSALPALEVARDGKPTVQLTADDGRAVYVHSRYQPLEEAAKLIDGLPPAENPTFILHGVGLGYHVCELERRYARPVVLLVEEDLGLLKAALCASDMSRMIGEGRLIVLNSTERNFLHQRLITCNADLLLGVQFVVPPHSKRCRAAFHERMRAAMLDFVSYARMQIVTLLKTSRVTFQNIAYNLPSYVSSAGVAPLRNAASGYPAIIVAAGPSLARNVRQLAELRGRAVIIATQTVYKLLLSLGIRPHFVTSLDFHEISAEFFRDAGDAGDCILVAEPKAAPSVLELFPGSRCVLHHGFVDVLLREAAPRRGSLKPGTTVAHLAYYLAEHLGCDPIVFVGQDLAYSDGLFYMPGSPIERIWQPELGRFQTIEMKQWERIVRNRSILRRVQDVQGREIYTDDLLFTYAEQFQKEFAVSKRRIVQASEGGLALEAMEVLPLREAAQRFCTRDLPGDLFAAAQCSASDSSSNAVLAQLNARLVELHKIHGIATEMRGLLEKLTGLIERPGEFNRVVARVDELRLAIGRHSELYNLIVDVSATAELRRHQADRQLGGKQEETREVARARLKRDSEFVSSFLDGCEFLERVLSEALGRFGDDRRSA